MKTKSATKTERETGRLILKTTALVAGVWLLILAALSSPACAGDDDTPFFAGANGAPNIMFIFDNSDSMQDIPYVRADGRTVRPGTDPNSINNTIAQNWFWQKGVQLNPDNTIKELNGNVLYDMSFVSDTEMTIPPQTPANLPGTAPASLQGTAEVGGDPNTAVVIPAQSMVALPHAVALPDLTGTMTSIPSTGRIYDTTLNMPANPNLMSTVAGNANFNQYYLYRYVKVVSNTGVEQIRTITGRTPASNYFSIDTTAAAGGPLVYNALQTPYTYTILTSQPSPMVNTGRVYDTSLDWTTAGTVLTDNTLFNTNYLNRFIEVKDKTGTTYTRTITGRGVSTSGGYFTFDTTTAGAGGTLAYTAAGMPYTYTILTDSPGRVTLPSLTTTTTRVYDANVDGSSITPSFLIGKLLTVTSGTNSSAIPPTRTILSYSTTGKYWTVGAYAGSSAGFPAPCDLTTRYEIKDAVTDTSRIYDADLGWTLSAPNDALSSTTLFNLNYLYRVVKLVSATGTVQERTILSRSTSGKYFTIDTAPEAGGPLSYIPAERPYTYTILTDGPGRVTRVRTDTPTATVEPLKYVTDADLDWTTIAAQCTSTWKNRVLVITSAGLNKDQQRSITDCNSSEKRWTVDSEFPVPIDLNTKYKILGTPDDSRYAFGGNHPASKLYQAKDALNLFLNHDTLKTCVERIPATGACKDNIYKYKINMGFATYLSARVPRVTAKYYRLRPGTTGIDPPPVPDQYCAYYKRTGDTGDNTYFTSGSITSFTAGIPTGESTAWKTAPSGSTSWVTGLVHTGVSVGYKFNRLYNEGNTCNEQTIHYSVLAIDTIPGSDGNPDQYKFKVKSRVSEPTEGGYWYRATRCSAVASCAALPPTSGSDTLFLTTSACYNCWFWAAHDDPAPTTQAYYETRYYDTYGYYNNTASATAQYVDRSTQLVTPWPGYELDSWSTTKTNPDPLVGDFTLLTPAIAATLTSVPINSAGTLGAIVDNTFDTSYFMYPGYGTTNQPHGWSYKKTSGTPALLWIYGQSTYWSGAQYPKVAYPGSPAIYPWPGVAASGWTWSSWSDSIQANPYFPAVVGDEMANFTGDDQTVFVNLPVYDGTGVKPSFGDDIYGANIDKILEYTDITRTPSPDKSSTASQLFDYTIMPYSKSIAPNVYSALQNSGTPLAESLKNLKKYYQAYITQDPLTRGGCRKNYAILLTDGLETAGGDPVQAAADLMTLEVDGHIYPVQTFVIGLGLDAASKATLNNIAQAGGSAVHGPDNDYAYFANNTEELVNILVYDIAGLVTQGAYSRSTPAITAYIPGEDLHLYSAYFDYPTWKGHLKGYDVDPETGLITGPATGWTGDCDAILGPDADAGCELKLQGARKVYTGIFELGTFNRYIFNPADTTLVGKLNTLINPLGVDIDAVLPAASDIDAQTIMHYTLDPNYDGGKYLGTRNNDWLLGDIYHSAPVVVGAPRFTPLSSGPDPYTGYTDFKSDLSSRETRVYVGANDGMVHAIKADTGEEDWAYIPNSVLGKLYKIGWDTYGTKGGGHTFTVDLPLKAADIYSPGGLATTIWPAVVPGDEKSGWHTLLASGLREGGNSYFALDVTDPAEPKPAWETTDVTFDPSIMGKTWSTPNFGRILINGVPTSVIFAGGGLSISSNTGNNVYILDAGTGTILKEITIGATNNHVPSEILVVAETDKSSPYYGNIVAAYFGDTSGDLWKLTDLNDTNDAPVWAPQAVPLHNGDGKVFHRPAISKSKGGCTVTVAGKDYTINTNTTFILYGTGDEQDPTNLGTTDRMYEIADPALSPVVITDLPLSKVWERQFTTGEKMLTDPFVDGLKTLYFITYTPVGGCNQGESFLWGLTTTKCGQAGNTAGLVYAPLDGSSTGGPWEKQSTGIGITSSPVDGGKVIYIQTKGGGTPLDPPKPTTDRLEYWRENL